MGEKKDRAGTLEVVWDFCIAVAVLVFLFQGQRPRANTLLLILIWRQLRRMENGSQRRQSMGSEEQSRQSARQAQN